MKKIFFILLLASLYSCGNRSSKKNEDATPRENKLSGDSLRSIEIANFRELRNSIYQGNMNKVKTFFKFPVLNYGNEIWGLVLTDQELSSRNIDYETLVPFAEKDFDHYFKNLFPKEFMTSILKIKSDDLFRKDSSSTEYFKLDSVRVYQMIASVDRENKILILNLFFTSKGESDYDLGGNESNIVYSFYIGGEGQLLFKEIRLAG